MNRNNNQKLTVSEEWADYKRLLELCYADRQFLTEFLLKPEEKLTQAGLRLDVDAAQKALEMQTEKDQRGNAGNENYYIRMVGEVLKGVYQTVEERNDMAKVANQKFKDWFWRQKKRISLESALNRRMVKSYYVPVSFELTQGCSVGCPFCCLQAPRLEGYFDYQGANICLWREILERTKRVIGEITGAGNCYFATEPFDNPDYEYFIEDFYKCFGCYPQTTTVKAVSDPKRTKALLKQLGYKHLKNAAVRFSVISKKQLEKIYANFTKEELACVELLLNNPESLYSYSMSGRATKLAATMPNKHFTDAGTSICTAGFVVNMVKRTVMLTAPRRTDSTHPLGMKVYDTMSFTDADSYEAVLNALIEKWMPTAIPLEREVNVGTYITYQRSGNYLRVQGDSVHRTISISDMGYQCFRMMNEQGCTLQEALQVNELTDSQKQRVTEKLQILFAAGYLTL